MSNRRKKIMKTVLLVMLLLVLFSVCVAYVYSTLPANMDQGLTRRDRLLGWDWRHVFQPGTLAILRGESPYTIQYFYSPPWVIIPLIPLAFLPTEFGIAFLYVLNFFCYLIVAAKLRMNPIAFVVFLLFSGMIPNSANANIEGIIALGFILPPQLGLFLLLLKPQYGIGVAVFWLVETWREQGAKQAVLVFLPVSLAFLLSFTLYGFWPLRASTDVIGQWWNASIFPRGVPIGLLLLALAIYKREMRFAIAASPFFSPYLTGHTWSVVWFGLLLFVPNKIPDRILDGIRKLSALSK